MSTFSSTLFWRYLKGEQRAHACRSTGSWAICFGPQSDPSFLSQTIFVRLAFALLHHQTAEPQTDGVGSRAVRHREYHRRNAGKLCFSVAGLWWDFGLEQVGWNNVERSATSAGEIKERRRKGEAESKLHSQPAGLSPTFGRRLSAGAQQSLGWNASCLRFVEFKIAEHFISPSGYLLSRSWACYLYNLIHVKIVEIYVQKQWEFGEQIFCECVGARR